MEIINTFKQNIAKIENICNTLFKYVFINSKSSNLKHSYVSMCNTVLSLFLLWGKTLKLQ